MSTQWVRFDADGPHSFREAVGDDGKVSARSLKGWFRKRGLGHQRGVYIVASGMKNPKPWYVGLAAKQTFRAECSTPDKVRKINRALESVGKGAPVLLFLTVENPRTLLAKHRYRAIHLLETELIRWCVTRNDQLINVKKVRPTLQPFIQGVLRSGPGKPLPAARAVRKTLGIGK